MNSNDGANVSSSANPFSATSDFRKCSQDQRLPFLCTRDVEVKTVSAENVTVRSMPNDSVVISWTESRDMKQSAWNLTCRTVTIYDKNRTLVATLLASTATPSVVTPALIQGQTYNVLIWPHTTGSLMNGTVGTTFLLLRSLCDEPENDGALTLPVRITAALDWRGWAAVSWDQARRRKYPFNDYGATSYQIVYGYTTMSKDQYFRLNQTGDKNLYYVSHLHGGEMFHFYLVCFFGPFAINCGKAKDFHFGQ